MLQGEHFDLLKILRQSSLNTRGKYLVVEGEFGHSMVTNLASGALDGPLQCRHNSGAFSPESQEWNHLGHHLLISP
jgi:hypothetical protein